MRVAQLICSGSFAGAESVACSLASALVPFVERSLLYVVVETRAGETSCCELVRRAESFGVETRLFETDRRLSWSLARSLRATLRHDQIDIAHSHSYKTSFMLPLIRQIDSRAVGRIFFTLHGVDLPPSPGLVFIGTVHGVGAYLADGLIACSGPLERYYRRLPLVGHRTRLVLNGLRPGWPPPRAEVQQRRDQRRRALAQRFGLDPEAVWVAMVGRLVAIKRHDLMLGALQALRAEPGAPRVQLLVAGQGPLREQIEQAVQQQGLTDSVQLLGQVSDLEQLYGAIDVLAMASDSEGAPMVVIEAMAFGVPVIATRVGSIEEQVGREEGGILYPPDDASACLDALRRITLSESLRRRLGDGGVRRAKQLFTADAWAMQHVGLYERVLRGSTRSGA